VKKIPEKINLSIRGPVARRIPVRYCAARVTLPTEANDATNCYAVAFRQEEFSISTCTILFKVFLRNEIINKKENTGNEDESCSYVWGFRRVHELTIRRHGKTHLAYSICTVHGFSLIFTVKISLTWIFLTRTLMSATVRWCCSSSTVQQDQKGSTDNPISKHRSYLCY
jgi:hypothetical protein